MKVTATLTAILLAAAGFAITSAQTEARSQTQVSDDPVNVPLGTTASDDATVPLGTTLPPDIVRNAATARTTGMGDGLTCQDIVVRQRQDNGATVVRRFAKCD